MKIDQRMKLPTHFFTTDSIQLDRVEDRGTSFLVITTHPSGNAIMNRFDLAKSKVTSNLPLGDRQITETIYWKIKQGSKSIRLKGKHSDGMFKGSIFIAVFGFFPAYWSLVKFKSKHIDLLAEIREN